MPFNLSSISNPIRGAISDTISGFQSDPLGTLGSVGLNPIGTVTNIASEIGQNVLGSIAGVVGINTGHSGSATAVMRNPRNKGIPFFHGPNFMKVPYRAVDEILKAYYGRGVESFGWKKNKVPSKSSSSQFKNAEDAFYSVIHLFLNDVISGKVQIPSNYGTAFGQARSPLAYAYLQARGNVSGNAVTIGSSVYSSGNNNIGATEGAGAVSVTPTTPTTNGNIITKYWWFLLLLLFFLFKGKR